MLWQKLRTSPSAETASPEPSVAAERETPAKSRLTRLARKLDELPAKDQKRIEQAQQIEDTQRRGVAELHDLCSTLVRDLNRMLEQLQLEMAPQTLDDEAILRGTGLLFQINASGRIVQLAITHKETKPTTEYFRSPYLLRGAVRWFNQELLERHEIQEHQMFYCTSGQKGSWRFMDSRTRRSGSVSRDYLMERLEELL